MIDKVTYLQNVKVNNSGKGAINYALVSKDALENLDNLVDIKGAAVHSNVSPVINW